VGFLKRLLGGPDESPTPSGSDATEAHLTPDEIERAYELELARFEQDRTTDLVRRQQQYSDRSWTPPPQGGTVRAGADADAD
jgi:hypothetical protein